MAMGVPRSKMCVCVCVRACVGVCVRVHVCVCMRVFVSCHVRLGLLAILAVAILLVHRRIHKKESYMPVELSDLLEYDGDADERLNL